MKRILSSLITLMLVTNLSGCVTKFDSNVDEVITQTIKSSLNQEIPDFTNIKKDYYAFYLPRDVGRKGGTVSSNVLIYNGNNFVMCVNVPNVVKDHYYYDSIRDNNESQGTLFSEDIESQEYYGTYVDYGNRLVDFTVLIITVDQDLYYLQMSSRYLSFGAVVYKTGIGPTLNKMLSIARTVRINYELIATDFSNRETATTSATDVLELFKEKKPSSGYVIDLINPKNKYDNKEEPNPEDIVEDD